MALNYLDWICIGIYFLISIIIGIRYASRAGESLGEFFLSGRSLPWYIAGFSMVATTFAADTPLAVTELVNTKGIAGNWLWWNMLAGGMLTVFFFAKYWRRANILTDVELIELRYGGKAAAWLRGFRAIYIGVFMNSIIIGWVNKALVTILIVFFNIPEDQSIMYVAGAMVITAIYSSVSGLWGVAITDFIQFIIAMTGCIVLAVVVVNSPQIGGMTGLEAKLPANAMNFLPRLGDVSTMESAATGFSISLATFLAYVGLQWWASWYPGAEPGGGGYIAQRMMSAKDEKHSLWATLFFQVAHYCLRPWPWIIVGLCTVILYPQLGAGLEGPQKAEAIRAGYVIAMKDFLPAGLRGLLLVAFLAAYMSTISTQLNWGASYFINDIYKRFLRPEEKFPSEAAASKHYVLASRVFTMILMLIALFATTQVTSISGAWEFVLECSAGLGLVLILRWYWWRINVWSEITATIVPLIILSIVKFGLGWNFGPYPNGLLFTVAVTTVSWLLVTFLTPPEKKETLLRFYDRIQPQGAWEPVRKLRNSIREKSTIPSLLLAWFGSVLMTYCLLFFLGKILFSDWIPAMMLLAGATLGFLAMRQGMKGAKLM